MEPGHISGQRKDDRSWGGDSGSGNGREEWTTRDTSSPWYTVLGSLPSCTAGLRPSLRPFPPCSWQVQHTWKVLSTQIIPIPLQQLTPELHLPWSLPRTKTRVHALLKHHSPTPPTLSPPHSSYSCLGCLLDGPFLPVLFPLLHPMFTSFLLQARPHTAPFIHLGQLPQFPLALRTCPMSQATQSLTFPWPPRNVKCCRTKSCSMGPDSLSMSSNPLDFTPRPPPIPSPNPFLPNPSSADPAFPPELSTSGELCICHARPSLNFQPLSLYRLLLVAYKHGQAYNMF